MRPRLSAIKPPLVAVFLLLVSTCGTELYLRVREPLDEGIFESGAGDGSLIEPSPILHHRLRPLAITSLRNPDTGEAIEVVIDSHGLRGSEVAIPKPPDVLRVLCLGDETVFGAGLPEASSLPARLQELLQAHTRLRVEVLNGGVPGDCPLLAWLRLRNSLLALQPDVIVLHFDMSDVADDQRYRRRTRVEGAGTPVACCHPAAVAARQRAWWQDLRLTALAVELAGDVAPSSAHAAGEIHDPRAATAWLRDSPPDWSVYVEQALAPIEDIRRAADGSGAAFAVAMCPQPWQVSPEASDGPGVREAAGVARGAVLTSRAPFEAVAAFARERGMLCCDASPAFHHPQAARLFFRSSPQLSPYGQELYAHVLSEFLATTVPAIGAPTSDSQRKPAELAAEPTSEVQPAAATSLQPWEPVRYQ